MYPPSPDTAGREVSTPPPDEILRKLDRLALRTAARARSRVRARVAARSGAPQSGPVVTGPGDAPGAPLDLDTPSDTLLSRVAVLPGLPRWIGSVLSLSRGSASVLRPEYAADGSVRDYTVVGANQHVLSGRNHHPSELLGRPLSEVRPGAVTSGMYDLYAAALERNGPVGTEGIDYIDVIDGRLGRTRLRGAATPLEGEGLLLTNWETHSEAGISRRIQESSRMGWAEWDLVNGEVQWSQGMRELLGLTVALPGEQGTDAGDGGDGVGSNGAGGDGDGGGGGPGVAAPDPEAVAGAGVDAVSEDHPTPHVVSARDISADLRAVGRLIDPADVPAFAAGVRRLLSGEEVTDCELTLHVAGEERRVRWVGFPRPADSGDTGTPESLLFAVRDITEQERELRSARGDAERMRQEAAAERKVSETLRKALTPPLPDVTPSWLSVGAAYVPCDARVGGDWYKCRELPDGRVLVAVGDASGHGVDAASRAVQQRSALAGLAYTDGDPAQLTTALGEVVHSGGVDTTATAVIGHLDPETRVFRWASAGHPSPILVRDDVPRVLDAEHGLMLGVTAEASYPVNTTQLAPGDLLLLYTDGVVERRGHDLDTGVASLLEAVVHCAGLGTDAQTATDCLVSTLLGPEIEDDATILGLHVAW